MPSGKAASDLLPSPSPLVLASALFSRCDSRLETLLENLIHFRRRVGFDPEVNKRSCTSTNVRPSILLLILYLLPLHYRSCG